MWPTSDGHRLQVPMEPTMEMCTIKLCPIRISQTLWRLLWWPNHHHNRGLDVLSSIIQHPALVIGSSGQQGYILHSSPVAMETSDNEWMTDNISSTFTIQERSHRTVATDDVSVVRTHLLTSSSPSPHQPPIHEAADQVISIWWSPASNPGAPPPNHRAPAPSFYGVAPDHATLPPSSCSPVITS